MAEARGQSEVWLSATELGRRLGVSESTIRSWSRRYAELLPRQPRPEGGYVYPLALVAEIHSMQRRKMRTGEIRSALAARQTDQHDEGAADLLDELTWRESILSALARIEAHLKHIADHLGAGEQDQESTDQSQ